MKRFSTNVGPYAVLLMVGVFAFVRPVTQVVGSLALGFVGVFALLYVVNWASRVHYRVRGGWRVHLTFGVRANVDWEQLTDAEVSSTWARIGRPMPGKEPEGGWQNARTKSLLLWFTDAHGERCEVLVDPEPNPRVAWVAGLSLLLGRRDFMGFPRSLPIVLFARFSRRKDLLTSDEVHEAWAEVGGDEHHLPARGMRGEDDSQIEFECRDAEGNLFFIKRGARTQFTRWWLVGPLCLMYRDLMPASVTAGGKAST